MPAYVTSPTYVTSPAYVMCPQMSHQLHQVIPGNDQNMSPTNQKTAESKLEQTVIRQLFGVNLFTGMPSYIPGEKSGI